MGVWCQGTGLLPTLLTILIIHLVFASFYKMHLQLQFGRPHEQASFIRDLESHLPLSHKSALT